MAVAGSCADCMCTSAILHAEDFRGELYCKVDLQVGRGAVLRVQLSSPIG